jgi:methyltransferase (TIGR00027 family)
MNIENVSDTARWVAVYRAMETERPDALFRDPWARRLAGEKGEAIVRAMPDGERAAWSMIVRTAVFDETILTAIRQHRVDLVLNLAAGLDTRAWRLELPESLRWIDVDLPEILAHKQTVMADEVPRCRYEAISADLTAPEVLDELLSRLGAEAERALVVSEGLLIYLGVQEVAALASALHAEPAFQWWLTDLASPRLLKWMHKRWSKHVGSGDTPFRFAPAEGSSFFQRYGWREVLWRGTLDEARRLRREMRGMVLRRLVIKLFLAKSSDDYRRFSGYLLLTRV